MSIKLEKFTQKNHKVQFNVCWNKHLALFTEFMSDLMSAKVQMNALITLKASTLAGFFKPCRNPV